MAQGFRGQEPPARRGPELHGRVLLSRAAVRLSQHRTLPPGARLGRLSVPVRRHHPVLDARRGRARVALLLLRHVGQRARSRPRRLPQLRHRRSRDASGRAVHRRHPPAGSVHARGRPRDRHRQADPCHQDRRDGAIAGRLAVAHRGDRGRLTPPISRCASATASSTAARSTISWKRRSPSTAGGCRRDRASASSPPRAAPSICSTTTPRPKARRCPDFTDATKAALKPMMQDGIAPKNPLDVGIPSHARSRRQDLRDRRERSQHRHGRLGLADAAQDRCLGRRDAAAAAADPGPTSRSSASAA